MSCTKYMTDVALYAGGELDANAAARVEAHLAECAECGALCEDLRGAKAVLADLGDPELEDEWVESVHRKVMLAVGRGEPRRRRYGIPALAFAAAVILAVVLAWPRDAVKIASPPVVRAAVPPPTPVAAAQVVPVRHPAVRRRRRPQVAKAGAPLLVQFTTDDPNIVIYWLIDSKPQGD